MVSGMRGMAVRSVDLDGEETIEDSIRKAYTPKEEGSRLVVRAQVLLSQLST